MNEDGASDAALIERIRALEQRIEEIDRRFSKLEASWIRLNQWCGEELAKMREE